MLFLEGSLTSRIQDLTTEYLKDGMNICQCIQRTCLENIAFEKLKLRRKKY